MTTKHLFAEYQLVTCQQKDEYVPCLSKGKMFVIPVYIPYLYNVFLNFLEEQVHKDSKLEIMTNVGKSHLYKHSQKE